MKQLSKQQKDELAAHIQALNDKTEDIGKAYGVLEEAYGEYIAQIGEYNGKLAEVVEWRDGIVGEMTEYKDERSDKWQEGEQGEEYQAWIDEWEGIDLDELDEPNGVDEVSPEHAANLEELPVEP